MKYHPIEMNRYWQCAANQLKREGYTYIRRESSIVPGVFVKGDESKYLFAEVLGREQVWVAKPTSEMPQFFTQLQAAHHAGMSLAMIKKATGDGRLKCQRLSQRTIFISDESLLEWSRSRSRRGGNINWDTYRTRDALNQSVDSCLYSMLRSAAYEGDIDYSDLFTAMEQVGIQDPESLMLTDIDEFHEAFGKLQRQTIIKILEIK